MLTWERTGEGQLLKWMAVAAAMLVGTGASTAAETIEAWRISASPDAGPATGCVAMGPTEGKFRVAVFVDRNFQWSLTFFDEDWSTTKGESEPVSINVDRRALYKGSAVALGGRMIDVAIDGSGRYLQVQNGAEIAVQTRDGSFTYELTGAGKALPELLNCVRYVNKTPPPTISTAAPNSTLPFSEAVVILTNLFQAVGVQGYRVEPLKTDNSLVILHFADGSTGGFWVMRDINSETFESATGDDISSMSRGCKGDFVSGKREIPTTSGALIRQIAGTCRNGTGTYFLHTTVILRRDGLMLTLEEHSGPGLVAGSGTDQKTSGQINASLGEPNLPPNAILPSEAVVNGINHVDLSSLGY